MTQRQAHTPGEWTISMGYVRSGSKKIANLSDGTDFAGDWTNPEQNANARLIAAAPELLSALQTITDLVGSVRPAAAQRDVSDLSLAYGIARAALAKATQP